MHTLTADQLLNAAEHLNNTGQFKLLQYIDSFIGKAMLREELEAEEDAYSECESHDYEASFDDGIPF